MLDSGMAGGIENHAEFTQFVVIVFPVKDLPFPAALGDSALL
jgi:hypothetical protein